MLKKDNFFKNYFINFSNYKNNLAKTKKAFTSLLSDLENNKIPMLESFEKDYEFDFTNNTIKKFSKYKNIVIVGIGGSALGAKSIYSFLKKKIKKEVFFFDNLDLNLNFKFKKIKNLKNSCFIVISKSGNTLETIANLSSSISKNLLKNKLIIITEIKDNALMSLASRYEAEIIEHKEFIGGRYSVLSETGMYPAALMGLNLEKFKNLKNLIKKNFFTSSLIHNVASIYTLNLKGFKNSVILNYDSDLNDLSYWYQQLVAESLGKKGKGINPIISFGPKDHHSLLQLYLDGPRDKFFTFFNSAKTNSKTKVLNDMLPDRMKFLKNKDINFIINSQSQAVKNIFKKKKIPFREIYFNKREESELGGAYTFFVLETILLSRLMKVDPFNQPDVEQVKIETKKILS
tara:strand:+ start:2524 stop:3732 length:1209 start_codon:yes stop_codon:yes gene_type:complete